MTLYGIRERRPQRQEGWLAGDVDMDGIEVMGEGLEDTDTYLEQDGKQKKSERPSSTSTSRLGPTCMNT